MPPDSISAARAETATPAVRLSWPLIVIVASFVVTISAYWQTFEKMARMWSLATYQYCWCVFPIALGMLWHERARIGAVRLKAGWGGLAVLGAIVVAWITSTAVGVQVVEFFSATLIIPTLVWSVGGVVLLRNAMFPLLFPLAAVPVGDAIVPALMQYTASIAAALLQATGIPAFHEGTFITLPGGLFEVAEVCSGLRYLLTGTVLSVLFAYWNFTSLGKRAVFVVTVVASLIVANGIRAFIVMYVASTTDMQVLAGRDHVIFGAVMFAVLTLLLMYAGSRFADAPARTAGSSVPAAGTGPSWHPAAAILGVAVLVLGPLAQSYTRHTGDTIARLPVSLAMPGPCVAQPGWSPGWKPTLVGADLEDSRSWHCGAAGISVYQAAYASQRQGKELVSTNNAIWPTAWRRHARLARNEIRLAAEQTAINEVLLDENGRSTVVWYWYDVDGNAVRTTFGVKFREALAALRLATPNSAIVVLIAEGPSNDAGLRKQLQHVVDGMR